MIKRLLTLATHRIYSLPVIVLMPHSSCNCRCVMCDIWKANHNKKEIALETLEKNADTFERLGVREAVLSGGEALMHSNLWKFCSVLRDRRIKITLLSTGLLLRKNADDILRYVDEVIVSLDGSEAVHDKIRNIPHAFARMAEGIAALKDVKPGFRITGRCVLQHQNYFDFVNIVKAAKAIGLDQISFLPADVSSQAFNHPDGWPGDKVQTVALSEAETRVFSDILEESFTKLAYDYRSGFIAENPARLKRIVQYYDAVNNHGSYPVPVCNAPWVSAVVESDGAVAPCFFHKPYGNINDRSFSELINSPEAIAFRKNLNMATDDICRKCVCSLRLRPTQML